MTGENYIDESEIRQLMKKGLFEVPNTGFEEKVMKKIELVNLSQKLIRKNVKASWIFLAISILLFPLGFAVVFNHYDISQIPVLGASADEIANLLLPAGILLFAVLILLQIDNLLRLTIRTRLF